MLPGDKGDEIIRAKLAYTRVRVCGESGYEDSETWSYLAL